MFFKACKYIIQVTKPWGFIIQLHEEIDVNNLYFFF